MDNNTADLDKQCLLLEYLMSSPDTYTLCSNILKPEYFAPEYRNAVEFMQTYFEEYNSVPDEIQIKTESGVTLQPRDITRDKIEYCAHEVEKFCQRQAVISVIKKSPTHIRQEDFDQIQTELGDALTISLHTDLGVNYFENPLERILRLKNNDTVTTTGWDEVDHVLGGGIRRKEMILFSANSGGGKSIAMSNLGLNLMKQGLNVLYVSLELSADLISKRFDVMLSGIGSNDVYRRAKETAMAVEAAGENGGSVYTIRMPSGTKPNDIKAYLKEFQLINDYVPDVLIVDYLDLMGCNGQYKAGDVHEKDKQASEQLIDIAHEYDMYLISAAQQNRTAVDMVDLNHSHIAGGISKVNSTDVYISIILTDQMRAQGRMMFQFLKTRSSAGVGENVHLNWNATTLCITNRDDFDPTLPSTRGDPTQTASKSTPTLDSINGMLNLMDNS